MWNQRETLATKLIIGSGIVLLLLAASATPQSTAPASTSAVQSTPATSGAPAQEQKPADTNTPADEPLATIRTGTNEVNVVFTVTDKHGRRITDMKQGDFRVLDD